jgi:mRNA interferase HigB
MKVRLIKRKSIEDFTIQNAASRSSFRIWVTLLKNVDWTESGDINETFGFR